MDYFYFEADYLAINISSPNTENLRELSSQENLEFLLEKISQKKVQLIDMYKKNTPIFVKVSPDETDENLKNLIVFASITESTKSVIEKEIQSNVLKT